MKTTTTWIEQAQNWLRDHAAAKWTAWLQTAEGQAWKAQQNYHAAVPHGFGAKQRTVRYHPLTPYQMGFSLPLYHHDLIKAVGKGDEKAAKAIMSDVH